jgi:hypothetical protein
MLTSFIFLPPSTVSGTLLNVRGTVGGGKKWKMLTFNNVRGIVEGGKKMKDVARSTMYREQLNEVRK